LLTFHRVTFKNFFSFGNTPTTVFLDKNQTTLITGVSGSGKSTILEAICYGLYGKAFRDINKNNVVNTVNNKDCLIEISFSQNGSNYTVRRGLKPGVFEIYCDGQFVNQNPNVRDYQKYLEENILKMNYSTFTQVVVLGYANYKPFMTLSAGARRSFVDEMLGTAVFRKMYDIAREEMTQCKNDASVLESSIAATVDSLKVLKDSLKKLRSKDKEREESLQSSIKDLEKLISSDESEVAEIQAKIDELTSSWSKKPDAKKQKEFTRIQAGIENAISKLESEISFFDENSECPVCKQEIDAAHKDEIVLEHRKEIEKKSAGSVQLQAEIEKLEEYASQYLSHVEEVRKLEGVISRLNNEIFSFQHSITEKQKEITNLVECDDSVTKSTAKKIVELSEKIETMKKQKAELNDRSYYYQLATALLKDDGIKASIIRQYIPMLNKLVNEYLDVMNFHMKFMLDENFEETILSRFRDTMSYQNLSQGEQSRISIALMLAWRKVAEMRNSVSASILFFDEILDASIASSDINQVFTLVEDIANLGTNVIIISHKPDGISDLVRSEIRVVKNGNFSKLT
jgi:DNA repair exonuclease SbcCD ATPase subunit